MKSHQANRDSKFSGQPTLRSGHRAGTRALAPCHVRYGYSLLELLIAMAVLAVMAAMTLPSLQAPLDKSRLRAAAKQIQAALAKARSTAIREGRVVEFRFEPGGAQYTILRVESSFGQSMAGASLTVIEESDAAAATPSGLSVNSADSSDPNNSLRDLSDNASGDASGDVRDATASEFPGRQTVLTNVLPAGTRFLSSAGSKELLNDIEQTSINAAGSSADNVTRASSRPIIFLPTGRAQETVLRIQGSRDFAADIHLRGLTGAASWSAPFRLSGSQSLTQQQASASVNNSSPAGNPLPSAPTSSAESPQ